MAARIEIDGILFSEDALLALPEHSAAIGRIVTRFSFIESLVGGIYGALRHENIEDAMARLKELHTNQKRMQAVISQIRTKPQPGIPDLEALIVRVREYAEQRNQIAHGLWGYRTGDLGIGYCLSTRALIKYLAPAVPAGTAGKCLDIVDSLVSQIQAFELEALLTCAANGEKLLEDLMRAFLAVTKLAARAEGWTETP